MDNEVTIRVTADNDTGAGFGAARHDANMTAADIEGTFKKRGPKIGDELSKGVKGGVSGGFLSSIPAVAQFAVGASPILGAGLSAAVIGGAGIGGVVGGVLLASKDPRVSQAATAMAATVFMGLQRSADVFVTPLVVAADKVGDAWTSKLGPRISSIFGESSKFVAPLTDGIISALDGITRGLDAVIGKAQPVISSISGLIANVGDAIGDMMETVSGGSDDAAKFVDDLSDALGGLIRGLGYVIRGLTEFYGMIHDTGESIGLWIRDVTGAEEASGSFAKHIATTDGAMAGLVEVTNASIKALRELADEMMAQTDPLFAVRDAQRDVTDAQKDYNDALKKHGPKSAEAKESLDKLGQAAFRLNAKVGDAAGGFNGSLTPAMRTALRNAGLTSGQIGGLEKQLRSAARAANAWEGTFTQTYITRRIIKGPGGQNLSAGGGGRQAAMAHGGIKGAASGQIGDGLTWVGENGPELLDLPPGAQVHSNPDSRRMASQSSGQAGAGVGVLTFDTSGLPGFMRAFMEALRLEVREAGGNVQEALGVAGR